MNYYADNNEGYVLDINDNEVELEAETTVKSKNKKVADKEKKHRSFNMDLLQLLIVLIVIYLLFAFIIISVRINGPSMEPTYHNGDRAIMLRTTIFNKPKKYDAIVIDGKDNYQEAGEKDKLVIKRVIGIENDSVEIKDNKVYVNGEELNDKYRSKDTNMSDYALTFVPEGYVFVLGDNRNNSRDSRSVGLIKTSDIKAVHGLRYWPINKIGLMK